MLDYRHLQVKLSFTEKYKIEVWTFQCDVFLFEKPSQYKGVF